MARVCQQTRRRRAQLEGGKENKYKLWELKFYFDVSLTFDQEHHFPWQFQLFDQFLEAECTDDFRTLRLVFQKRLDLVGGTVVGANDETMVVHV